MAVRFNLDKFQTIKLAYIAYISTGKCTADMLQNFAAYKPYLEADEEIKNIQREIKSRKAEERRRIEEQKKAEQKRLEEQRQAKNAAAKAAREAAQAKKAAKAASKKKVTRSAGNYDWTASSAPIRRVRGRLSPVARRLQDVNTFDDVKRLMSSSFLDTIKSNDDLAVLRSTIIRCTENHEEEKKDWLKIVEQRRASLQAKTSPKHDINYINPKAVFIPTPMGGQNKRY